MIHKLGSAENNYIWFRSSVSCRCWWDRSLGHIHRTNFHCA